MEGKRYYVIGSTLVFLTLGLLAIMAFWLPLKKDVSRPVKSQAADQQKVVPVSSGTPVADKDINEKTFVQTVGALQLVELIQGEAAKESIFQLHRTTMDFKQAYVAKYAGGQEQMTIWVSVAPDETAARRQIGLMHEKIDDNQLFSNHQTAPVNGINYHFVEGMGQAHYFYQRGDDVIWIAIQASEQNTMKILANAVKML